LRKREVPDESGWWGKKNVEIQEKKKNGATQGNTTKAIKKGKPRAKKQKL